MEYIHCCQQGLMSGPYLLPHYALPSLPTHLTQASLSSCAFCSALLLLRAAAALLRSSSWNRRCT
jgi:hypothetical protein